MQCLRNSVSVVLALSCIFLCWSPSAQAATVTGNVTAPAANPSNVALNGTITGTVDLAFTAGAGEVLMMKAGKVTITSPSLVKTHNGMGTGAAGNLVVSHNTTANESGAWTIKYEGSVTYIDAMGAVKTKTMVPITYTVNVP